jgi:malonyl-CoA/methylmalonyl-CoA synthetase
MGRMSVDIIKSGGCKISALEVEAALLEHPAIAECAVIGSPDEVWGEAVCAAVVLVTTGEDGGGAEGGLGISDLRVWCKSRMSAHKVPRHLIVVRELPRNAMGKVTKPALRGLFS